MIIDTANFFNFQIYKLLKSYAIIILFSTFTVATKLGVTRMEHFSNEINTYRNSDSNSTQIPGRKFSEMKNNFSSKNKKMLYNETLPLTKRVMLYCQEKPKFNLYKDVLLTFLLRLKLCQLVTGYPWFDEECAKPLYDLTDYHKTSYAKMCNPTKYAFHCKHSRKKQNCLQSTIIRSWLNQINISKHVSNETKCVDEITMKNIETDLTRLEKMTCQSIESYFDVLFEHEYVLQKNSVNFTKSSFPPFHNVQYTEWFFIFIVFCENVACGVSAKNYANFSITFLDCVADSCRSVITGIMVFDGVLTLTTVVANFLILIIFFRTSILNNIPGYFKLSLAFSDLGVGIIIMPSFIYNRYRKTHTPLPYRNDTMRINLNDYFSQSYIQASGFFWIFFVFVSLYTLCAASVDRYLAITRPFKYEKRKYLTKNRTVIILLLVWLIGAALAAVPFFVNSSYGSLGDDVIIAMESFLLLLYGLFLAIPLIIVWIFNILLLSNVRSQYQKKAASYGKSFNLYQCNSDRTNQNIICVQTTTNTLTEIKNGAEYDLRACDSISEKTK